MPQNGGNNGVIEYRRRLVSSLLTRQPNIRQREIQRHLETKVINPDIGSDYSLGTINNDIQVIKAAWMEKAGRDYGEWVADEIGGLDEVEAAAWQKGKLDIVLRCKERRAKLLGLDAPAKHEVSGPDGDPILIKLDR